MEISITIYFYLGSIAAADVFVIPSLAGNIWANLPGSDGVLEFRAAGFDTGGIPDMIKDGETVYGICPETGNASRTVLMQIQKSTI
ncbi:MAG: hypothetical protein U5K72_14520 [Balneolaceae bacterium]|nr:hypothetical protein [Balneolaceae bacterium]